MFLLYISDWERYEPARCHACKMNLALEIPWATAAQVNCAQTVSPVSSTMLDLLNMAMISFMISLYIPSEVYLSRFSGYTSGNSSIWESSKWLIFSSSAQRGKKRTFWEKFSDVSKPIFLMLWYTAHPVKGWKAQCQACGKYKSFRI